MAHRGATDEGGKASAVVIDRIRVTVSGVRNVSHLVHAHSYLTHLAATASWPVVVAYLGSGQFLGRDNVPAAEVDRLLGLHGQLAVERPNGAARFEARPGEERVLLCVGAPSVRALGRMVRADPRHPPRVVVVDEGIGTYGDRQTRLAAYRRQGGHGIWPVVRSAVVATADRVLTSERWPLYAPDASGRWAVVEEAAAPIRALLSGEDGPPGRAVLLTQPWVDLRVVTEDRYLRHIDEIAAVLAERGLSLVVRPHPAEPTGRYAGRAVINTGIPAELDRAVISADLALGADSTALLDVAALWGTRAMRVTMPELGGLGRGLSEDQRALLDTYLPAPVLPRDLPTGWTSA